MGGFPMFSFFGKARAFSGQQYRDDIKDLCQQILAYTTGLKAALMAASEISITSPVFMCVNRIESETYQIMSALATKRGQALMIAACQNINTHVRQLEQEIPLGLYFSEIGSIRTAANSISRIIVQEL
jgi:hypothetical protein